MPRHRRTLLQPKLHQVRIIVFIVSCVHDSTEPITSTMQTEPDETLEALPADTQFTVAEQPHAYAGVMHA